MNKKRYILTIFTVVVTVLLSSAMAKPGARQDNLGNAKKFASATFTGIDASGCISTEVNISGRLRPDRKDSVVFFDVIQFDDCKEKLLFGGKGKSKLASQEFTFDRNLDSASLSTMITIRNSEGRRDIADVNISWTGFGNAVFSRPLQYIDRPGHLVKRRHLVKRTNAFHRVARLADASGSIIVRGKDILIGQVSDEAAIFLITPPGKRPRLPNNQPDDPVEGKSVGHRWRAPYHK